MKICVFGATGAVGREMVRLLQEKMPDDELYLFSGKRSAGAEVRGITAEMLPRDADGKFFSRFDALLSALPAEAARNILPRAAEAGVICIDNSSAFRHAEGAPLVLPHINGSAIRPGPGIIANPNCSTAIALTALGGIIKAFGLKKLTAATYQAASGAGAGGLSELERQARCDMAPAEVFPKRLHMNVIPMIGSLTPEGTTEELKLEAEGRKILGLPGLEASCVCVRVPVRRCHSIAMWAETEKPVTFADAEEACRRSKRCIYMADGFPTPLDCEGREEVFSGRLRIDDDGRVFLWCCGDQLLRGAALNAVEILEKWKEISRK